MRLWQGLPGCPPRHGLPRVEVWGMPGGPPLGSWGEALGMRVEPPTSTTSSMSDLAYLASSRAWGDDEVEGGGRDRTRRAFFTGFIVFLNRSRFSSCPTRHTGESANEVEQPSSVDEGPTGGGGGGLASNLARVRVSEKSTPSKRA